MTAFSLGQTLDPHHDEATTYAQQPHSLQLAIQTSTQKWTVLSEQLREFPLNLKQREKIREKFDSLQVSTVIRTAKSIEAAISSAIFDLSEINELEFYSKLICLIKNKLDSKQRLKIESWIEKKHI